MRKNNQIRNEENENEFMAENLSGDQTCVLDTQISKCHGTSGYPGFEFMPTENECNFRAG